MPTLVPPKNNSRMILVEPDIRTQFSRRLRLSQLELFLEQAMRAAKLRGDVSVLLTGDKQIRRWNREFRGKNKPTDVLSFPAAPVEGIDGPMPAALAGDLAISLETADRQAAEQGHSLLEELKVLLLHGVLHLAGYDHEVDQGEMARVELRLRARLGLKSALIERVQAEAVKAPAKPVKRIKPVKPVDPAKSKKPVKPIKPKKLIKPMKPKKSLRTLKPVEPPKPVDPKKAQKRTAQAVETVGSATTRNVPAKTAKALAPKNKQSGRAKTKQASASARKRPGQRLR